MQAEYKAAVEQWITAIRDEEALASANHSEIQLDRWEAAGFKEGNLRQKTEDAKSEYEKALRQEFFNS